MKTFQKWIETTQNGSLYLQIMALRPQMAKAAQAVYDEWEHDEDGLDHTLGGGGICDQISNAIGSVIVSKIPGVESTDGGQDGDDHSWIIVYNQTEAYHVDIHPSVYERGGGYNWTKIPNVIIKPTDIEVFKADMPEQ